MKWRVVKAEACGAHSLDLTFKDGTRKRVNLLPVLEGPVFEPLRDPKYFARVELDPLAGTVVWPNGADVAPETLYELASNTKVNAKRRFLAFLPSLGPTVDGAGSSRVRRQPQDGKGSSHDHHAVTAAADEVIQ